MSVLTLSVIVLVLVPAAILLASAIVARVQSHRVPASPGPRFSPTGEGVVLRDALLLNQDRRAVAAGLVDLAVRRKIRLLRPGGTEAPGGTRAPIAVETVEGVSFQASEVALLEALFGRESSSTRVRRLSADSRSLARRVRAVLDAEEQKGIAEGLFGARRCTWPVVLLRIFAVGGIASSLFFVLAAGGADFGVDWVALGAAAVGLATVIVVLFVTPRPWRRFSAASDPLRTHLAGMREYVDLAEKEPLRFLQSVQGAQPRSDVSAQAAADGLQRFHLNERMLPYAVLFGMEKSWLRALGEHAGELRSAGGVGDVLDATFEVLTVIELVGGALELVRAVGDLADATGSAAELVGGVFDALS